MSQEHREREWAAQEGQAPVVSAARLPREAPLASAGTPAPSRIPPGRDRPGQRGVAPGREPAERDGLPTEKLGLRQPPPDAVQRQLRPSWRSGAAPSLCPGGLPCLGAPRRAWPRGKPGRLPPRAPSHGQRKRPWSAWLAEPTGDPRPSEHVAPERPPQVTSGCRRPRGSGPRAPRIVRALAG